jgi:hypothetical protein
MADNIPCTLTVCSRTELKLLEEVVHIAMEEAKTAMHGTMPLS